jgi:hypothetical protein
LVYAPDSKSGEVTLMRVRVSPPAPNLHRDFLAAENEKAERFGRSAFSIRVD